jgi:hypothetical protein
MTPVGNEGSNQHDLEIGGRGGRRDGRGRPRRGPVASAAPQGICGYYVTSKIGLNLRASWSKESARRATMPYGAKFAAATDVTHSNEGILWREVYDYNGLSGWADNSGMAEYTC